MALDPIIASNCNPVAGDATIGLYMAGNTTGTTSGTVDALSLSFAGEGAASVGLSGGSVVISVIQDGAGINAAIGGNTAGVLATVATGTLLLAGGNNITLSQVGNAVTISGPNSTPQSVQSLGLFAGSNTTVGTSGTADARSLSVSGAGAVSVKATNGGLLISSPNTVAQTSLSYVAGGVISTTLAGSTLTVSATVPAQTAQTLGLFASSNTTGQSSSSTIDARSLTLQGAGIASVGMSGGKVVISVPSDVGDGGNVIAGGTQTAVSTGTVVLSNSNNVSFGMSNSSVVTASASFPAQTNQTVGLYAPGLNSSGTSSGTADARSLSFNVSGLLSADMTNSEVNLSVPYLTWLGGGNTSGVSSGALTGAQPIVSALGNLTVNVSQGLVRLSVGTQTNQQVGIFAVSNTTQSTSQTADARSLSFAGAGIASVGVSGGTVKVSVPAQSNDSVGLFAGSNTTQSTSNSADIRSLSFGGAGIASVGVSGNSVLVSVPSPAAQTNQQVGLFAGSNTTQSTSNTADARSLSYGGAGAASVGVSGNSVLVSVPVQTNQQVGLFAVSNTTQSTSNTADARSLSFGGAGAASLGVSGNSVVVSVPTQTNQTLGLFAVSNTTQSSSNTADARSLSFAGAGAASVGISGNTVKVSVPAVVAQTNQTVGLFAVSNTTQATSNTADARSLSFGGTGAVSVGVSGSSVLVSAPAQSSLVGTGNVSLIPNGSTISISGSQPAMSYWPWQPMSTTFSGSLYSGSVGAGGNSTATTISAWVQPLAIDAPVNYADIRVPAFMADSATTTANYSFTGGITLGLYTKATNATSLSLLESFSNQVAGAFTSGPLSYSSAISMTYGGSSSDATTSTSASGTALVSALSFAAAWAGSLMIPLRHTAGSSSLSAGQYVAAVAVTYSTAGQNLYNPFASIGMVSNNLSMLPAIGSTLASTEARYPLLGVWSTVMQSNTVWPLTLATSNITTLTNNTSWVNNSVALLFANRT